MTEEITPNSIPENSQPVQPENNDVDIVDEAQSIQAQNHTEANNITSDSEGKNLDSDVENNNNASESEANIPEEQDLISPKDDRENVYSQYRSEDTEETEPEDDSYILNENPERLKTQLDRIKNDIRENKKKFNNLNKIIHHIEKNLVIELSAIQEAKLELKIEQYKEQSSKLYQELTRLYDQQFSLDKRLKKAEKLKRNQSKSKDDYNYLSKEAKSISAQSLFQENEPIENSVIYVATFFPDLSTQDFERVVSYLLESRTIAVAVTSKVTTEQGEIRLIENSEDKPLIEIWKKSLCEPEKILSKCYLKVEEQEDKSHIIKFYLPIQEKLKEYLQTEQPLYLSEQFKRARLLLFDTSKKVAENAMYLSVDMALASPYDYGKDWLFERITEFTKRSNQKINSDQVPYLIQIQEKRRERLVFSRISSLITEMLSYPQLQGIVESFLKMLMSVSRFDAVWKIVKNLRSAPKFEQLYWVKLLLDQGDDNIRTEVYRFLYRQLYSQKSSDVYKYLEIIKTWLPEKERPLEKYSPSNKRALWLLFDYCLDTTSKLDSKYYGDWPSKYRLFAPLSSIDKIDDKLEMLVSWLFHPGLKYINKNIKVIELISLLIVDWFKILTPDNKWFSLAIFYKKEHSLKAKEHSPEASDLFDKLIQKIIVSTDKDQQKELIYSWVFLAENYFKESEKAEKKGDRKLRKEATLNRNLVRKVKKKFNTLQKNASFAEY